MRRILLAFAVLFFVQVALKVHGFSLPVWWQYLQEPIPDGVLLLGTARGIRSDDYVNTLPHILAQIKHSPPFPVINTLIGEGQNMLLSGWFPVNHWSTFFRPQVWGYFISADLGLAWHWAMFTWGTAAAAFFFFAQVTRQRPGPALGAALLLVFSPFLQFWGLNSSPLLLGGLLSAGAGLVLLRERKFIRQLLWSILLFWSAVALALSTYPPFQIPLAYALFFVCLGVVWSSPKESLSGGWRSGGWAVSSILFAGLIVFVFFRENANDLQKLMQTQYPGQRFSEGGGYHWPRTWLSFFLPARGGDIDWGTVGNRCEAGGFLRWSILLTAVALLSQSVRFFRSRFFWSWIFGFAFIFLWSSVGHWPGSLGHWLLLDRVPASRVEIAIGILESAFAAWFFTFVLPNRWPSRANLFLWATGVLGLLFLTGFLLQQQSVPGLRMREIVVHPLLIFATLAFALVGWFKQRRWAMVPLVLASILLSVGFNPVVRGGASELDASTYAQHLRSYHFQLSQQLGRTPRWISLAHIAPNNLLRALGLPSLTGWFSIPQLSLWRQAGLETRFEPVYNRASYVSWVTRPLAKRLNISEPLGLASADHLIAVVDDSLHLPVALKVDAIVASEEESQHLYSLKGLKHLGAAGHFQVFQVLQGR